MAEQFIPLGASISAGGPEEAERRRQGRRKVKLKRIYAAEVDLDGSVQNCFLHIQDLSEAGMRVHTDLRMPTGRPFPVRLILDDPIDLTIQVAWQKELIGGMQVLGVDFLEVSEETRSQIQSFLGKHSPENKRSSLRLQRILVVEMLLGSTRQKFGVFTLDISTSGMRISHDFPLPEDIDIPFAILLEYDQPPIDVTAKVNWQKSNAFGQFVIGVEFRDVTEATRERIEQFIESQIRGELSEAQTFATLEDFNQW